MENTEEEDFTRFAACRRARIIAQATLITGDRHAAEDIAQEGLIKMASRWGALSEGGRDAYLRRVIFTVAINYIRRSKREYPMDVEAISDATGLDRVDRHRSVLELLAHLTARQRAVLLLRYVEGYSQVETARILGVSVGTIRKISSDARAKVRKLASTAPNTPIGD